MLKCFRRYLRLCSRGGGMIRGMWNWDCVGRMWLWPNYSTVLEFYSYFLLITDRICFNSFKHFESQQCDSTLLSNAVCFPKEFF
jgi:hypothetical protein